MQKLWRLCLVVWVGALVLMAKAHALPADNFHLRLGEPEDSPWGAAAFYQLAKSDGGVGLRADLGMQLSYFIGPAKAAAALIHVQHDSAVIAYAAEVGTILASPIRVLAGVDVRSPMSYLGEGQIFFPLGAFEPFITLRMQSTGFSVTGGDGYLYKTGSSQRFWSASGALGAGYALHPDLRVAASYTYRTAFGATEFRDASVFHLSVQWLWGAGPAQ